MEKAIADMEMELGQHTGHISYLVMDLTSLESVRTAAKDFLALGVSLDVLFMNAAAIYTSRKVDPSGTWELMLFCAFVGHVLFTDLLIEKVKSTPGSRIIIVGSEAHNPATKVPGKSVKLEFDNIDGSKEWDSQMFYKNAKLLNLYHTYWLSRDLANSGVCVNCFCPGFVPNTSLAREHSAALRWIAKHVLKYMMKVVPIDVAADNYVYYATCEELGTSTGGFYKNRQKIESSPESHDSAKGERYMQMARETINKS